MEYDQSEEGNKSTIEFYNYCIRLLARRDYSVLELLQKLQTKFGAQQSQFNLVIERLQQENYQSDQRFAEAYVRFRARKGFGPERIAMELNTKGIASSDIEQAIDEFDESWEEIMDQQWRKKFNSPPTNWQEKAKQCAYLKQRGYGQESIVSFMDSLMQTV